MTKVTAQEVGLATRVSADRHVLRRVDLGLTTPWNEPQTETELRLAKIWQEVLGVDAVGAADDFFELGGDSFAATVLATEIEATLKVRFAPSDVINLSTISKQARAVAKHASNPSELPGHLVVGHAGGSQPPLFVVHGMAGFAFLNHYLIKQMGEDRPVYLFQVPGLDGRTRPLDTFEEIAEVYVSSMRKVQPGGPYNLLAFCGGAFLALEMCKQIEASDGSVERLILLDPLPLPPTIRAIVTLHKEVEKSRIEAVLSPLKSLYNLKSLYKRMFGLAEDTPEQRLKARAEKLQRLIQSRRAVNTETLAEGKAHPEERSYSPEKMLDASLRLRRASQKYVPCPYPGRATLLVCARRASTTLGNGSFWRSYLGGIDYQVCDGKHDDIFGAQIVETGRLIRNALKSTVRSAQ